MTYDETLDYLFSQLPVYQRIGSKALKKDLSNTEALCRVTGNPEKRIKTIHVAGSNGKGSVSHMLCAILIQAGYNTGLYTSPHMTDFRERIKLNGTLIPKDAVVEFVETYKQDIEIIQPSFFEMTAVMAFWYFARENTDVAVIETGLGGRLDSTNVITPELSVITNISLEHTDVLGNTLPEIAAEKAGIIKAGVPVVIGKKSPDTEPVFTDKANASSAPLEFAEDSYRVIANRAEPGTFKIYGGGMQKNLASDTCAAYQCENIATVLKAIDCLQIAFPVAQDAIAKGLANVTESTGFKGRWHIIGRRPLVVCDIAHNEDGIRKVMKEADHYPYRQLHIVYGTVKEKDPKGIFPHLPAHAEYYFCSPLIERGMSTSILEPYAMQFKLNYTVYNSVMDAFKQAISRAAEDDLVLITGSLFVVSEMLSAYSARGTVNSN